MTSKKNYLEAFVENSKKVKNAYIHCIQGIKYGLKAIGLLNWLEKRIHKKWIYHYLRSLLAIHQLEDFILLDVPWWTYAAIKEIENYIQQLPAKPLVWEYGSGASTIWLAKRSAQVFSVEHDKNWFFALQKALVHYPHVTLFLKEPQSQGSSHHFKYHSKKLPTLNFQTYVEAINDFNEIFDIIIIDGRCREACLSHAISHLKPTGIIVFDNSNRQRYQATLKQSSLTIQRFAGLAPGSPFPTETAILRLKKQTKV